MSDARRYSSDRSLAVVALLLGTLVLGGCSHSGEQTLFASQGGLLSALKPNKSSGEELAEAEAAALSEETPGKANESAETNKDAELPTPTVRTLGMKGSVPGVVTEGGYVNESAWCRYLRASAETEATIVGSPSLSASSDDEGSGSVSIGMNLLDLRKAKLLRQTGDAKCRLHQASRQVSATPGLGAEAKQYASAQAKYEYIRSKLSTLSSIRKEANRLLANGLITSQDANLVKRQIEKLKANMQHAKAEADTRRDLPAVDAAHIRGGHGALVQATSDLQYLDREIRTAEAFDVTVSTGYRYNERFNNDLQASESDGYFARVKLGVKLGALSPRRVAMEEEAAAARIDALHEENSGAVWKTGFADRSLGKAEAGLRASERSLAAAAREADDTIAKLKGADRSEVLRTRMMTRIERIVLGAELASVRAGLRQIGENRKQLQALSQ